MDNLQTNIAAVNQQRAKHNKTRYYILAMIFLVTSLNYGDRATLSMAAAPMSQELGLSSVTMGYIFSAFGWAYVIGQIPGGWLLDKFGARRVYFWSIMLWSFFTILLGFVDILGSIPLIIASLFLLRFLVGLSESPAFPGNSQIVAAWFPTKERGTAAAIFNSAQYFATVIFAPFMGWLVAHIHWQSVFWIMGGLGIVIAFIWLKVIYSPEKHPTINSNEFKYLQAGGAITSMGENQLKIADENNKMNFKNIKKLLSSRMLLGIFIAQYCITCLTYFFITWFPVYLVKERHMSILEAGFAAVLPALCGFIGGVLGGVISDKLIKMNKSLTFSRKFPIIFGMLLSTSIVVCNYVDSQTAILFFMSLAFFGKGFGALGWAVMSDVAPKEMVGLSGGLFNTFGNTAGIVIPIAIGYIINSTGSFNGALVFVGIHAVIAIICYLFMVGKIQRFELKPTS
ncbi:MULTISPECIES: MFS transporter [Acinetobacter calcoaceticus/baumannii complex]|uniref:D-glucarate/D-galactarate permease (MFS superfamily) n=1 Tax=Acinetobacter pittii (strain PHEA-2) TaxID=871585 RepID=F0KHL7_ACIP2|nr:MULTISPECIES: MFS transporter [Acinetobacter calcoaceticus/baumannii complex]YP_004994647.1 D-glucarate/D-galactarate permease (MFS superfamily) [Acinetobacter pittii PHEA-2]ADY80965.1 D-glucarate/D-galactarate permease (MFS superfamily) [Acinetobacter pittii PHEA-2]EXE62168.1 putative glucarate transporter [Acinetobacter sp. 1542444]EXS26272.1 putative glucarate transporter [Acinetobacter sp. 742879]MDX8164302.1 MFS transporter [Acinetobacter pittii]